MPTTTPPVLRGPKLWQATYKNKIIGRTEQHENWKAIKKNKIKTHQKNLVFEMEKPEAKHQGRSRGRELRNRVLSACTASASAKAVLSQTEKDIRWVCECVD